MSFLLNNSAEAKQAEVVAAPAFSLTKVLATAAAVVAPIATLLVDNFSKLNLSSQQYVTLAIGVLGFLAIASAADVLARSIATSAENNGAAARTAAGNVVSFSTPLPGLYTNTKGDPAKVDVVATCHAGGKPQYLVKDGEKLMWLAVDDVTLDLDD